MGDFLTNQLASLGASAGADAVRRLSELIPSSSYVGELLKLDYGSAEVLVHDYQRQATGGLPLGSFVLASRIGLLESPDPQNEDASLILLRVTGVSRLPNALEMDFSRFEAGKRASDTEESWDAAGKTDQYTLHQLRFSGVHCRVLGTYLMRPHKTNEWRFSFGTDISNFYSGRGLKIYKPSADALRIIANFPRPELEDSHPLSSRRVRIGRVRYASSERGGDSEVPVELVPADLIARRTALFGMSRTGKSNTTKMIAAAVFKLRGIDSTIGRVGQLIFDVNGEYANDNPQDGGALRNVINVSDGVVDGDVVTYGQSSHPFDSERKIIKINFFGSDPPNQRAWEDVDQVRELLAPLLVGKQAIDSQLAKEQSKYIKAFRDTSLESPEDASRSEIVRYRRALVVYRTILAAAGFRAPSSMQSASIKSLFNKDLLDALSQETGTRGGECQAAAQILRQENPSWDQMRTACAALRYFITDGSSGYQNFNTSYQTSHDGRSWHDDRLTGLLALFEYPAGIRTFRSLIPVHDPNASADYAEEIASDLVQGRLVIVDQSMGDPDINRDAAERIMWAVFNRQKAAFVSPKIKENGKIRNLPDVIVYAEEAHNLLPAGSTVDLRNIWSRVAKEGSKYRIGLVYATQEPSSLQSNILKNTDNWFVAHLNNTDEVKELRKYYDFADFADSIIQATDPGFIRMRTLSNPYIVPVQVDRFIAPTSHHAISE